jgi:hypothetical protein
MIQVLMMELFYTINHQVSRLCYEKTKAKCTQMTKASAYNETHKHFQSSILSTKT